MVSIKPIDAAAIIAASKETGALVSVEDANRYGGLGSAVAEVLSLSAPAPMEQVAMADTFAESGESDELREKYGLSARMSSPRFSGAWSGRRPTPTGQDEGTMSTITNPWNESDPARLAVRARNLRIHIVRMTTAAGSGHVTSAFSAAEIVAAIYFHELRFDPSHMEAPDRDRFILSKGTPPRCCTRRCTRPAWWMSPR